MGPEIIWLPFKSLFEMWKKLRLKSSSPLDWVCLFFRGLLRDYDWLGYYGGHNGPLVLLQPRQFYPVRIITIVMNEFIAQPLSHNSIFATLSALGT
jgi:hypothetical protein